MFTPEDSRACFPVDKQYSRSDQCRADDKRDIQTIVQKQDAERHAKQRRHERKYRQTRCQIMA